MRVRGTAVLLPPSRAYHAFVVRPPEDGHIDREENCTHTIRYGTAAAAIVNAEPEYIPNSLSDDKI